MGRLPPLCSTKESESKERTESLTEIGNRCWRQMVIIGLGIFETHHTISCALFYPLWLKDLNSGPCYLNSIQEILV